MQQLRVTRKFNATGAVVMGVNNSFSLGKGKTYYCSNDGATGRDGTDPNYPILTITEAIGKCASTSNGDAVVVMQMSPSTAVATETWPISLNKPILLTGLYSRAGRVSDSGFGSTPTNTNCLDVAANFCGVENLYMQVTTGTTGDVIGGLTASRYGFTLRNCWIGLQNTSRYGLNMTTWDMPYLLIEDNAFSAPNVASMTSALYLGGAGTFGMVRRNVFYSCSSYAIDMVGSQAMTVIDNDFRLYSDTDGFAIHCAATTNHNYFARNHAMHGILDLAAIPYQDLATDGKNAWSMNATGDIVAYAKNS